MNKTVEDVYTIQFNKRNIKADNQFHFDTYKVG